MPDIPENKFSIPIISYMSESEFEEAKSLLETVNEMESTIKLYQGTDKEPGPLPTFKKRLAELQSKYNQPGLRYGRLVSIAKLREGRKTLDRGLLLENGVSPEQIANSYKIGKGYTEVRVEELEG